MNTVHNRVCQLDTLLYHRRQKHNNIINNNRNIQQTFKSEGLFAVAVSWLCLRDDLSNERAARADHSATTDG